MAASYSLGPEIEGYLAEGNPALAEELYRENRGDGVRWELPEPVLGKLIQGLAKAGQFPAAKPYLREFIRRFPDRAGNSRLLLARVLIEVENRPASGLAVLQGLPAALSENQNRARELLTARAKKLQEQGVIEMELDGESGGD